MGYVARLAAAHVVSPSRLVLKELAPKMMLCGYPKEQYPAGLVRIFRSSSPLIQGNELEGTLTTTLIQSLEALTLRRDLSQLSILHKATDLFAESQLRKEQAWCPVCWQQWQQAHCVIYLPLIWLVQGMHVCPQHANVELTTRCPHCQKSFPPLCERSRPGYCPRCQGWLGSLEPLRHIRATHDFFDLAKYLPDPVEIQLLWVDEGEQLLAQLPKPFFPPKSAIAERDPAHSQFKP